MNNWKKKFDEEFGTKGYYVEIDDEYGNKNYTKWQILDFIHQEILNIIKGIVGDKLDIEASFFKFNDGKSIDWVGIVGYNYKRQETIKWFKDNGFEEELKKTGII